MNPKIAVVSMYDENYSSIAEVTIHENFKNYCELHGYNLVSFRIDSEFLEGRHPQWGKIKIILDIIQQEKFDWVFFIDCDCLFMNPGISLEEFIDDRFQIILPEGGCSPDNPLRDDLTRNNIMSSQMLVKSSPESLNFFKEIWDSPDWPEGMDINEFDHEMRQIRLSYKKDHWRNIIKLIPEKNFNRFWPVKNPFIIDSFPNIMKNIWEPGDFIVHVTSYEKNERHEILSLLSHFVGGEIGWWKVENNKILFKPLKNLEYFKLTLFVDGEESFHFEFNDTDTGRIFWARVESDIILEEKQLEVKATDSNMNTIATFKF